MFNWDDEKETTKGFLACQEAVLGLLAQGKPVTMTNLENWFDVSLGGIDENKHIRRHAKRVASRILHGPQMPEN